MPLVQWGAGQSIAVQRHSGAKSISPSEHQDQNKASSNSSNIQSGDQSAVSAVDSVDQRDSRLASEDAAEWNSLLTWARNQRGPQYDMGTGMYVVLLLTHSAGKYRWAAAHIMGKNCYATLIKLLYA